MENTKILTPAPYKTYFMGYYGIHGGTVTDRETGEVNDIVLDRWEIQLLTPIDLDKWGNNGKFGGFGFSTVKIPFDSAFTYFGMSKDKFDAVSVFESLIGKPIQLHTSVNGKGKLTLRGITLDET